MKLFVDMDGVITDCDRAIAEFNNIPVATYKKMWRPQRNPIWVKTIENTSMKDFFAGFHWESNGRKLIRWLYLHQPSFTFLTRPVQPPEAQDCIDGKKIWLRKNGLMDIPVIFEYDKEKYAVTDGEPNVLIDDHTGNIDKWIAAGGIGLFYANETCQKTIDRLNELFPARLNEVKIDNVTGLGATPDNSNIDYKGIRVKMRPSTFLKLAHKLDWRHPDEIKFFQQHLMSGRAIGAPFLDIHIPNDWQSDDYSTPAKVTSHDGRHRCLAIQETDGDDPIEVHLFFGGLRAHHLEPEWIRRINQQLRAENDALVTGPLFKR